MQKKSACYSWVLVVTELVVSGTQRISKLIRSSVTSGFCSQKADLQISCPDGQAEILEKYNVSIFIYLQLQVNLSIYSLTVSTYI